VRINSGRFERDMVVHHQRTGKRMRLARPHSLMVADRETVDAAHPGDIVGVMNPGHLQIGDTLLAEGAFAYKPLPAFQPEHFARVTSADPGRRKQLDKGMTQLAAEGAIQVLYDWDDPAAPPLIGAVGLLQFEVMAFRLKHEYKVEPRIERMSFQCSAWVEGDLKALRKPRNARLVSDQYDRPMILFTNQWEKEYTMRDHPEHRFIDYA